ncbi:MAG TPA: hypothetical protein P5193_01540, partial [Microthrixaceae bacterium]|nr:hypothetical protein [Microthrixaceae bacterium]
PRRSAAARIVRLSAGTLGAVAVVALGAGCGNARADDGSTPASVSRNAAETTTVDEPPAPSTAPTSTAAPATVDGADTASADSLADLDARIDGAGRSLDAADTATRQATDALNTDNEGTIP